MTKAAYPGVFCPRITQFDSTDACGTCRDCGMCVTICPQAAISRKEGGEAGYEYVVNENRCIGCGFCAAACPCGIWDLKENTPLA